MFEMATSYCFHTLIILGLFSILCSASLSHPHRDHEPESSPKHRFQHWGTTGRSKYATSEFSPVHSQRNALRRKTAQTARSLPKPHHLLSRKPARKQPLSDRSRFLESDDGIDREYSQTSRNASDSHMLGSFFSVIPLVSLTRARYGHHRKSSKLYQDRQNTDKLPPPFIPSNRKVNVWHKRKELRMTKRKNQTSIRRNFLSQEEFFQTRPENCSAANSSNHISGLQGHFEHPELPSPDNHLRRAQTLGRLPNLSPMTDRVAEVGSSKNPKLANSDSTRRTKQLKCSRFNPFTYTDLTLICSPKLSDLPASKRISNPPRQPKNRWPKRSSMTNHRVPRKLDKFGRRYGIPARRHNLWHRARLIQTDDRQSLQTRVPHSKRRFKRTLMPQEEEEEEKDMEDSQDKRFADEGMDTTTTPSPDINNSTTKAPPAQKYMEDHLILIIVLILILGVCVPIIIVTVCSLAKTYRVGNSSNNNNNTHTHNHELTTSFITTTYNNNPLDQYRPPVLLRPYHA